MTNSLDYEALREQALARFRVLDTLPERVYDDLAMVARALCGTACAAITLLQGDRQWLKARIGVEMSATPRSSALCDTAIRTPDDVLEVFDARLDARFAAFVTVVGPPYIRMYAGAPLLSRDGIAIGTLCVFDPQPGRLRRDQVDALQALARQVMRLFELRARNREQHADLVSQREQQRRLARTQRELTSANTELLREARVDALSGLANRRALHELELRVDRGEFDGLGGYAVLVLDVDHFKAINDTRGHALGDEVIRALGEVIGAGVRSEDLPFRLGGEEFGVFMPAADRDAVMAVAERIRAQCAAGEGMPLSVRLSAGFAFGPVGDAPFADVLERADRALYQAKRGGRDRVVEAAAGD